MFYNSQKGWDIKDANQLLVTNFKEHDYLPMDYVYENIYNGNFSLAKLEIQDKLSAI